MVRLGFVLLAQALAARVEHARVNSFAHLSEEDSSAAVHALNILEQLKDGSTDAKLQEQYREAIGEIEWEEDRAFLLSGMRDTQAPVMLGQSSTPGATLSLTELLTGRLGEMSWFTTRLGRLFTSRRDFAVEEEGGETKYMIDGFVRSLHSRMQISFPNEGTPRYVVRRAFNYLNPIAVTAGQYIYRVIRCEEEEPEFSWAGGCKEGEMLYTITKDRFGRGALWGQDEYRVYTGTGGCSRHGFGLLSCDSEYQIMYSLSGGLASGAHDTTFYKGKVDAIDGNRQSGRMFNGTELTNETMLDLQVATVMKESGSPRALNWPVATQHRFAQASLTAWVGLTARLSATLTDDQIAILGQGEASAEMLEQILAIGTPAQEALFSTVGQVATRSAQARYLAFHLAWALHLAKSLIWADAYSVVFDGNGGPTDDLLVNVVAALQDLTRENIVMAPLR